MGRSFESVRMAVKDVSARWMKASKALKKEAQSRDLVDVFERDDIG